MGSALSRWTMAYFAAALAFLVGAQALMVLGYGFPAAPVEAAETLVLVHMVTIGWLSLLICGALFQFVPVLVSKPLRGEQLVFPALLCLLGGLGCLIAGFTQLSGAFEADFPFLLVAGTLLPAGFALVAAILGCTLWSAAGSRLPLPARFVTAGLLSLLATAALGALFALVLSGLPPFQAVAGWLPEAIPLHAAAGFGGWLTLTAVGVSYRLLPMFMLSPDGERPTGRAALASGGAAVLLAVLGAPLESVAGGPGLCWALALVSGLTFLLCYGADLVFFYRSRKRRNVELNSRWAVAAFAALYLSVLLLLVLLGTETLGRNVGAFVYLLAFGWLSGLGLSQLYKIVPFLTWLECYGPVMGRKPTPRVQDLVVESRGQPWFSLYFLGVLAGTAALLADAPGMFRIAAAATLLATLAIIAELVLARRLSNVAAGKRLPEGTRRPRLFLVSPH